MTEHLFDNTSSLDQALAQQVGQILKDAVAERGQASLAVSGGRTPLGFFKALSQMALPWQAIVVTLVDERWVAPAHGDSNEKLVRDNLLQHAAAVARFVPMKNLADTPEAGLEQLIAAYQAVPKPFDVIILGMGDDGHTASLFPGADELQHGLTSQDLLCAVNPGHAPHARMSLTAHSITQARHLFLHISGQKKRDVLAQAMQAGPVEALPVRFAIQQHKVPLHVYWAA
ncbi:6-phosphogluconolactonase [Chitinivorax tropicus]|uniref:6-phosphogluconolactonase n=1 Tax=Chitinivorax tropicus TaxID=714531 RepID=A0A840MJU5_9PROT|nr:6-phosphogluconolactonase [Chitinivorax tropicus]